MVGIYIRKIIVTLFFSKLIYNSAFKYIQNVHFDMFPFLDYIYICVSDLSEFRSPNDSLYYE